MVRWAPVHAGREELVAEVEHLVAPRVRASVVLREQHFDRDSAVALRVNPLLVLLQRRAGRPELAPAVLEPLFALRHRLPRLPRALPPVALLRCLNVTGGRLWTLSEKAKFYC